MYFTLCFLNISVAAGVFLDIVCLNLKMHARCEFHVKTGISNVACAFLDYSLSKFLNACQMWAF